MSTASLFFLGIFLLAVLLDLALLRRMSRRYAAPKNDPQSVFFLGAYSPFLTWIKKNSTQLRENPLRAIRGGIDARSRWSEFIHHLNSPASIWDYAAVLVILGWALVVGKAYLAPSLIEIPWGREYLSAIQTHHIWTSFRACGACALWNGSMQGGSPAFVDPYGSMLHPLVVLLTLSFGVLYGAKLALVASFALAGLAQWWLGRILGLGRIASLWSALMSVAGGYLAGRMQLGLFGIVLSTACCVLVLPPLVWVARTGSRHAAVWLGLALASAILAGQGYMQIGLLVILPAGLLLLPGDTAWVGLVLRRYILAAVLALLLAAVFLAPMLHFFPQFGKPLDPDFATAQSFEYVLLNLVIPEQKGSVPALHNNYLGWAPVLLALFAAFNSRSRQERRAVRFLTAAALLALWVGSTQPLQWITHYFPPSGFVDFISGIRHSSMIAGLASPLILGLSAIGLDQIMGRNWPRLRQIPDSSGVASLFDTRWLLAIPLVFALQSVYAAGQVWIGTIPQKTIVHQINTALITPDLQWVNPPFGEHGYVEPAVGMQLKLSPGVQTWFWKDRPIPEPFLAVAFHGPPPGMIAYKLVKDVPIYKAGPERAYALVTYPDEKPSTLCQAHGRGGDIAVSCVTGKDGVLVVKENNWSGWQAEMDGQPARLEENDWLSVPLPAGEHQVSFRYRPWDVNLGLALSLLGALLAVYLWYKPDPVYEQAAPEIPSNQWPAALPDRLLAPHHRAAPTAAAYLPAAQETFPLAPVSPPKEEIHTAPSLWRSLAVLIVMLVVIETALFLLLRLLEKKQPQSEKQRLRPD